MSGHDQPYDRDTERHMKEAIAMGNSHRDPGTDQQGGYFSAGYNMPGYLPESDPEVFDSARDALLYLRDTLDRWADEASTPSYERVIAEIEETIRSLNTFNLSAGFTFTTDDYVLWIMPISKQEYDESQSDL